MKIILAILSVCCLLFCAVQAAPSTRLPSFDCIVCEFAVQYVEGYVASNATETKIINQIEKVCNVAPKPISTVCDNFVAKHLPMVIAAIEKRVPTATVCTLVGLCTPKTSILTKFAAPAVLDVVDA